MGKWVWVPKEKDGKDGTPSPILSLDFLKKVELFTTLSMEEDWTLFEVRENWSYKNILTILYLYTMVKW